MNDTGLKSCPFCGCEAMTSWNTRFGWQVFCSNELCFMSQVVLFVDIETEEQAVKLWNKRAVQKAVIRTVDDAPTIGGWISVKDRLPEEHPSMFYKLYGTEKWDRAMWRTESDRVLVTIKFLDGTRTVDKGKLQDGAWRTGVSPVLPQEVTHWALWPEPPKENE